MLIAEAKYLFILGAIAFISSLILTVLVRRWSLRCGFVDRPGGHKTHTAPVALGGGIVIFWVTMLPIIGAFIMALLWQRHGTPDYLPEMLSIHLPGLISRQKMLIAIFLAAAILHIMGLIDDKKHLGPSLKLLVQIASAAILATFGDIRFDFFIPYPFVTTVLSILWMVVIINAFNFLDNMDGLSAGIGIICAAMILYAALSSGQVFVSALLVILIGTLGGFLVFNFAPAKIFMGDAGTLLVGLLISVATIRTTYFHQQDQAGMWFNTLMPLIVLAVPLYDFISVTVLRLAQGKSPFVGDQQHFSHRLVKRGMSRRQAVITIYLATACTGLGATILHQLSGLGCLLVFIQTILILLIIAILERPGKG